MGNNNELVEIENNHEEELKRIIAMEKDNDRKRQIEELSVRLNHQLKEKELENLYKRYRDMLTMKNNHEITIEQIKCGDEDLKQKRELEIENVKGHNQKELEIIKNNNTKEIQKMNNDYKTTEQLNKNNHEENMEKMKQNFELEKMKLQFLMLNSQNMMMQNSMMMPKGEQLETSAGPLPEEKKPQNLSNSMSQSQLNYNPFFGNPMAAQMMGNNMMFQMMNNMKSPFFA